MTTDSANVVHRWSTTEVQAPKRASYFEAACDSALIPLRVTIPEPQSFQATIEAVELGSLLLMRHTGTAHACTSGSKEISRQREHNFNIVLCRNVAWQLEHRHRTLLKPNTPVMTDSRLDMHIEQLAPYDCVNIKMPEVWLRQWVTSPGAFIGRELFPSSPWGRVLTCFIGALTPQFLATAPLPARVLSEHLGALLSLVEADLAGPIKGSRPDRQLAARLDDRIRDRCTDTSTTAADIASSLNISVRTVHRTLAAQGRTFGAALIAARLETSARMLESSLFARLTTAEIGRRAGFSSPSHFARSFKQRTGASPARFRRETSSNGLGEPNGDLLRKAVAP